jgi:hypothetical protein
MWLTVAPCDDGGVRIIKTSQEMQVIKDDTHDNTENDFDACTFFCLCNCCGVNITLLDTDFFHVQQFFSANCSIQNTVKPSSLIFPLLRPPKALLS